MKTMVAILIALAYVPAASADEIGVRYANTVPAGLDTFSGIGESGGKLVEGKYEKDLFPNFYAEGAVGEYYKSDFDIPTSVIAESSVGFKVAAGNVTARVSQGLAYMPNVPKMTVCQYGTHISLSLKDTTTGAELGLERDHYSNGSSTGSNIGMNMTGLSMMIPLK